MSWRTSVDSVTSSLRSEPLKVYRSALARRLEVHESQVSRDARNGYFGIALERTIKILNELNVRLRTKMVEVEPVKENHLAMA